MVISSVEGEGVRERCRRLSVTVTMPPEIIMFAAFESMINRVSISPSPGSSRMANDDKDGSVLGSPLSRGAHLPTALGTVGTLQYLCLLRGGQPTRLRSALAVNRT